MERPEQRLGVGAIPAAADDSGQVVLGALQFVNVVVGATHSRALK